MTVKGKYLYGKVNGQKENSFTIYIGNGTGKIKLLALVSFLSGAYAMILRPFTFPRNMREYAHGRQASENNKQNTV